MEISQGIADLIRELPQGYEQACFETGAIQRKRDISNPGDLMMLNIVRTKIHDKPDRV